MSQYIMFKKNTKGSSGKEYIGFVKYKVRDEDMENYYTCYGDKVFKSDKDSYVIGEIKEVNSWQK